MEQRKEVIEGLIREKNLTKLAKEEEYEEDIKRKKKKKRLPPHIAFKKTKPKRTRSNPVKILESMFDSNNVEWVKIQKRNKKGELKGIQWVLASELKPLDEVKEPNFRKVKTDAK